MRPNGCQLFLDTPLNLPLGVLGFGGDLEQFRKARVNYDMQIVHLFLRYLLPHCNDDYADCGDRGNDGGDQGCLDGFGHNWITRKFLKAIT